MNIAMCHDYRMSGNQYSKNTAQTFKGLELSNYCKENIIPKLDDKGRQILKRAVITRYDLKKILDYKKRDDVDKAIIDEILSEQVWPRNIAVEWIAHSTNHGLLKLKRKREDLSLLSWLNDGNGFYKRSCYFYKGICVPTKYAVINFLRTSVNRYIENYKDYLIKSGSIKQI